MATATTTPSRPRFRQDLVAEPVDDNGQRFIDVIDPDTGYEYRFYEVEYSLACAMDGERDVAGLARWAQEELGITPTSSELSSVIATLGDLGYLDSGLAAAGAQASAAAPPPVEDIELGLAGGGGSRPMESVPQVDDIPLAMGGGATERTPQPQAMRPAAGDFAPAGGGRPEMSKTPTGMALDVDLSADLPLAVADVKEAVRASKVMKAAELPPDLAAALEEPAPPRPVAPPIAVQPPPIEAVRPRVQTPPAVPIQPPPPVVEPPRPRAPTPPAVVAVEAPRPVIAPTKPPVSLPEPPKVRPVDPTAEPRGTSPVLIFLLVLVVLGAGGFAFWKFYWVPHHQTKASDTPAPTKPVATGSAGAGSAKAPDVPPPPPPPLSAQLAMSTPAPIDIQVEVSGSLASVGADGAVVAQGDEIARLGGADKLDNELKGAVKDVTRVQGDVDKLTAARAGATGSAATKLDAKIKDRMESLAKKQEDKAGIEAELAKLVIKAPAAGTLKTTTTKGKKVAANDVIATIQPDGQPTAVFTTRPGQSFAVDQELKLTIKSAPGENPVNLDCKVSEVAGEKLTVVCPVENPPASGTEVILP